MNSFSPNEVRGKLKRLLADWRREGLPSRAQVLDQAKAFQCWREDNGSNGLWPEPPVMVTATLDDGMGFGLEIIHAWASAVGLSVHPLGLLKTPGDILKACRHRHPAYLGMTVLQFDSEEDLTLIAAGLPRETRLITGGPIFAADPDLALRAGVDFVARDVGAFLNFLMADAGGLGIS